MQVDLLQTIRKLMATHDLQLTLVTPPFEGLENFDYGLRNALDPVFDWQDFGRILVDSVPENTLLFTEDVFELHYALFRLPDIRDQVCDRPLDHGAAQPGADRLYGTDDGQTGFQCGTGVI